MEQHSFRVINSSEKGIYRIIDLTDTNLVGITEAFEFDNKTAMQLADLYKLEIEAGEKLCSKVKGYCVFVTFDTANITSAPVFKNDYYTGVLTQMSEFFLVDVIKKNPNSFLEYTDIKEEVDAIVPPFKFSNDSRTSEHNNQKDTSPTHKKNKAKSKWLKGWRLCLIIIAAIAIIAGFIICLNVFPEFREKVEYALTIIFGLPMLIIMFFAYADDLFARRK